MCFWKLGGLGLMARRNKKGYFTANPGDPEPLTAVCERRIRFEEIDPLGIVWHGRYPSYLEDGRGSFGDKYGLSYQEMLEETTVAPIAQMHIDYRKPMFLNDIVQIETSLHWTDSARLNFSYKITHPERGLVATAYTVQLFTDMEQNVFIVPPPMQERFMEKWKSGLFKN